MPRKPPRGVARIYGQAGSRERLQCALMTVQVRSSWRFNETQHASLSRAHRIGGQSLSCLESLASMDNLIPQTRPTEYLSRTVSHLFSLVTALAWRRLNTALGAMGRMLAFIGLLATIMGCTGSSGVQDTLDAAQYSPPPGAIVLRVEVTEVKFTDLYPTCADGDECVPFYFWYKYRARVKDVISGEWQASEVEFAHLQHAEFTRNVTRDCYVVLEPANQNLQTNIGVPLLAVELLSKFWKPDRAIIRAMRNGT